MDSEKKQNRHSIALKKNVASLISVLIVISLTACGYRPEASEGAAQNMQAEQETTEAQQKIFVNQEENSLQAVENTDSEGTAEELLDRFINGSIGAVDPTDLTSAFYISDLNMDSGEWDSFSVGEKADLDNDGENELIINGPYGGIYLDARDNKVYKFAAGDGTALTISYTYYNGAIWIMYSNRSSAGFEFYHMEKFEGADNLTAEMDFGEEFDPNHAEDGIKYTWNGNEISYDEYTALCSKIFAAEVSTNLSSSADKVLEMQNKENTDGQIKKDDQLGILAGEYEYQSDYGTGKLMIEKTDYGYDISDYESESSYRFLADSSNIDTIKDNRIYIKYPEQVVSDDTVIFSYYILEYSTDGINVYYAKSADEEGQFLYCASRKSKRGESVTDESETCLYEGEYYNYDVNEPSLEIKKKSDGTYQIQIDLFRMWYFQDGVGRMTEDGLEFTATGPWEKEVNGIIKLEEDMATVTILGQAWLDFSGINEYKFYKTSDVPHIAESEY